MSWTSAFGMALSQVPLSHRCVWGGGVRHPLGAPAIGSGKKRPLFPLAVNTDLLRLPMLIETVCIESNPRDSLSGTPAYMSCSRASCF